MIIRLPIDTKSLFYNICNDNLKGHTATVSTNIKQREIVNEQLSKVFDIDKKVDLSNKPDLVEKCTKNSKTEVKILDVFVFDKISVNGKLLDCDKQYAIYVKEEVDNSKYQYGRIKMHYPLTLSYEDESIIIDNKYVINAISQYLNNYAFLVNAFEYNTNTEVLNFDITILGVSQTPYSKIFINNKGSGSKMATTFSDEIDNYDMEIIALRKNIDEGIDPTNYLDVIKANKSIAVECVIKDLKGKVGIDNITQVNEIYPYGLYDIEYYNDGVKKYIIVESTSTKLEYFNLSFNKSMFLSLFSSFVDIVLVTDVNNDAKLHYYNSNEIRGFDKRFNSMMYIKG